MTDTGAARCDRCGRRLSAQLPPAVSSGGASTLCIGCAHPAYRAGGDAS